MKGLRESLRILSEGIKYEISGIKKLEGEQLILFCDIFQLPEKSDIYYNKYNIVINDPNLNEMIKVYVKNDALVLSATIIEHNAHIWVYQYFNDQLFESYLSGD